MITSYRVHPHHRSSERSDGSPKVNFAVLLLLRSEELGRAAYMGVHPTHGSVQDSHIVQGLSIAHGRGERRQLSPGLPDVISKTLEE